MFMVVCLHRRMSHFPSSLGQHVEGRGNQVQEFRRKNEGHDQRQRGMYWKNSFFIYNLMYFIYYVK